ncbi:MAG: aldolase/citrate lyase family protein [Spirochaetia bacterium]|jgi:2-keto-3-deoxy-L-rhamnonate aldolase RhmA|nr:aldolase/citrate lyase family protein [Spirochaetia bacterium]
MHYENNTKTSLLAGKTCYGTFQSIASSTVSEILAHRGFDWILVDMEHGAMDLETAGDMLAAIDRGGPTPLVRVQWNDQAAIKRVLDAGALGVMIPMVNTEEEARMAVSYCKYAPAGVRGLGAGRASLFGVRLAEYMGVANDQVMVMIQAEHKDAVRNIEAILAVPGIDVIFVGPYDLACSMGYGDQPGHPEVEAAIAAVLAAAQRAGVVPGIFSMDPQTARRRAAQGFRFIGFGIDSIFLDSAVKKGLETVHGDGVLNH